MRSYFPVSRRGFVGGLVPLGLAAIAGCTATEGGTESSNPTPRVRKSDARQIPYDNLMRDSGRYEGDIVLFSEGQVTQVLGGEDEGFQLRVYVTPGTYSWENDVLVRWDGERFLEDDVVEFWGRFNGLITYETVLGAERTIPDITAYDISLLNEVPSPVGGSETVSGGDDGSESPTRNSPTRTPPEDIPPQNFSGVGSKVEEGVEIHTGLVVVSANHTGESNFAVLLVSQKSDARELFVNEIGSYTGENAALMEEGTYVLDVRADGEWDIEINQPRSVNGDPLPQSLSGNHDAVEGPFMFTGNHIARGTHSGEGNYNAIVYPPKGQFPELIFNEIGQFDGETTFTFSGIGWVGIGRDGNWSLELE